MPLVHRPLAETFAAEVTGIDLAAEIDDATIAEIRALWLANVVLAFPGQQALTAAAHVAFSRRFGRLETDLKAERLHRDHPEILVLSNVKREGRLVGTPHGGQFWHQDLYFEKIPSAAGILHGIVVPDEDGETVGATLFADTGAAYDALPAALKAKVDGRINRASRVKSWPLNYPDKPPLTEAQKAAYPDVFHPLVRTHPETGRQCLFIGDISAGVVEGMPEAEGDALLRDLLEFITQPRFVYRHPWQAGDLLMWDNRACVHAATPFDASRYTRHMHRTTVMDDTQPYAAKTDTHDMIE